MFSNMTVGKKIILGFSSILSLLIIMSVIAFFSFNTASTGFSRYRKLALDTNLSGRVQANMLMVRMNVKDFIIDGDEKEVAEYDEYFGKMSEFLNSAKESIHHVERAPLIAQVEKEVKEYDTAFHQVIDHMKERNLTVNNSLNVKGPFMESTLTTILESANRDNDTKVSYNTSLAMKHLLLGRLYMSKFLDTNESAAVDRVHQEFDQMQKQLDILDKQVKNSKNRELLESVLAAKTEYVNSFDRLVNTINERNVLIAEKLDRIGPSIANNTENVKLSVMSEQDDLGPAVQANNTRAVAFITILSVVAVILGVGLTIFITRGINKSLNSVIGGLSAGAEQVAAAANQVSSSSQQMAEGSSEQASSLEEISSSLEEMTSMTKQNADNAKQANTMAVDTSSSASKGSEAMVKMASAINKIKASSDETAKIIKTIDEIAFQTNLLALNAAVEAARAGEAGMGFAVVAEEVRNLAQRSAEAAKTTSALIEESQNNAENGVVVTQEVDSILKEITESVNKMTQLIGEVSAASEEQAQGIGQVNSAVSQMDEVTQSSAANAEESASASEELSTQAEELNNMVNILSSMVSKNGNSNGNSKTNRKLKPKPAYALAEKSHSRKSNIQGIAKNTNVKKTKVVAPDDIIPLDDDDFDEF